MRVVKQKGYYAAVRKTEGKEWIDPHTINADAHSSEKDAAVLNRNIGPEWTKENPIQRIVPVVICEVEDG